MRHFPNRFFSRLGAVALLLLPACSDRAAAEQREFQKLEAAVGTVANADPADRAVRLEQLAELKVGFERNVALKELCLSAYQTFERAAGLMAEARKKTAAAEARVAAAEQMKAGGGEVAEAEQAELVALGKSAAAILERVSDEIGAAEKATAACQAERNRLRFEMGR